VELKHSLPMIGMDDCGGCCQTSDIERDGNGEVYGCHEKSTVFTHREEKILKQLRALNLRAKTIKEEISHFDEAEGTEHADKLRLTEELAKLRQRRTELESERIAAAEERMRLLGHV